MARRSRLYPSSALTGDT